MENQEEHTQNRTGQTGQQTASHRLHVDHQQHKEEGKPDKEELGKGQILKMFVHACYTPFAYHTPEERVPSTAVFIRRA